MNIRRLIAQVRCRHSYWVNRRVDGDYIVSWFQCEYCSKRTKVLEWRERLRPIVSRRSDADAARTS